MSDPIEPWPVIRRGANAHPVPTLQYLLRARGQSVTVDGDFGPQTEAAVRAFQTAEKLTVDGVVGPQTWSAIIVQVSKGSTGDAVRGVQYEFQYRTGSDDPAADTPIDGVFGSQTDEQVRGFQEALDLVVDGIVGPITWRALISGMLNI